MWVLLLTLNKRFEIQPLPILKVNWHLGLMKRAVIMEQTSKIGNTTSISIKTIIINVNIIILSKKK